MPKRVTTSGRAKRANVFTSPFDGSRRLAAFDIVGRRRRADVSSAAATSASETTVAAAAPAGWQDLLPLYDKSTLVATQRQDGWVVEVGLLLRRITTVRARHGLPLSPIREQQRSHHELLPHHSESFCWAKTMQHELLRGNDEIFALAREVLHPDPIAEDEFEAHCRWTIEAVDAKLTTSL